MRYNNAVQEIEALLAFMDKNIDDLAAVATPIQKKVYQVLKDAFTRFDIKNGKIVSDQDLRAIIISVEDEIERVIKQSPWNSSILDFLSTFETIQERNVKMQRDINDLKVDVKLLNPARKLIYEQAKYQLTESLAPEYIQPAKFLLMQQATSGNSLTDALQFLEKWDNGELAKGKYTNDMPAPNLQKYATQIARDTSYGLDRNLNSIIKERYGLGSFIYVGGIVEDSRPLCRHLVQQRREIKYSELPELLSNPIYQKGLIAGTTVENFTQRAGGYACRHKVLPVKTSV